MFVVKLSRDVTRGDLWPAGQVRGGRVTARRQELQLERSISHLCLAVELGHAVFLRSNGLIIDVRT